jgi:hypothetical protein
MSNIITIIIINSSSSISIIAPTTLILFPRANHLEGGEEGRPVAVVLVTQAQLTELVPPPHEHIRRLHTHTQGSGVRRRKEGILGASYSTGVRDTRRSTLGV